MSRNLRWWKSSRSGSGQSQCVEVATAEGTWYVRDSKDPNGGVLAVDGGQWRAFIDELRSGTVRG